MRLQLVSTSFTHCPFYLLRCDTNAPWRWFNLHKTNAANEELVSRLFYGCEAQGGIRYTDCSYHSNSLSNKMGNSLLAVRAINHKYIVVGGYQMNQEMFCFQCEQTAGCSGCTKSKGVCGKSAQTAKIQDEITGALIGLSQTLNGAPASKEQISLMIRGLFSTLTNVNFNDEDLQKQLEQIRNSKTCLTSPAPDYDMENLWNTQEDIRSLKSLILFGLRGVAAYAYHAMVLGYENDDVNQFFFQAMSLLGKDGEMGYFLPTVLKVGEINFQCMELLDRANTQTYGTPAPATVSLTVEKGPFIVISGHDLRDLKLLLEQTKDSGVNVYTHGEMLPAHAYPELKKYTHLKGNFGTAWQNQQKEFADIPAPVLFTTNCLMPPKDSYRDRVFTTEVVSYPGMVHIGEDKDFTPVIQKAKELGGYSEDQHFHGINGGTKVTTGFGHRTILSVADQVVEAVKTGALKHFFLVGGCDGARTGRNYYTEFVKQTPADSVVLTLACGKYRFHDLDLGTIGSLPRLMDMGQCNDAYGAIRVALALAEAFQCGVNDLPLTLVLSWYEQKAVCILLTLLHLGIKNIYLGPTLPAFVSPNVLNFLMENYQITPISTPEEDLKKILKK